jgi:hypothetical protein
MEKLLVEMKSQLKQMHFICILKIQLAQGRQSKSLTCDLESHALVCRLDPFYSILCHLPAPILRNKSLEELWKKDKIHKSFYDLDL